MIQPPVPQRPYTVSELTRRVRELLEESIGLVWLVGEVTNLRRPTSGHVYLTIKDDRAQIAAVMWRATATRLPFDLRDGMEMVVLGDITVYEPRGQYQIVVQHVQPRGVGALQLAFLQLKQRLEAEGLFDPARKRPLPFLPRRIGIVTSPTGAAIQDMLRTLIERFPPVRVLLRPARVQGEGAAQEIAQGIADLNRVPDVDVIIVGRGGGSLEDLWAFNEEVVARAIAASRVPVVSGVGHEIDVTISDLVADRRALTPTDAANVVTPEYDTLVQELGDLRRDLAQALRQRVAAGRERLEGVAASYAMRRPMDRVRRAEQQVDELAQRFHRAALVRMGQARQRIEAVEGRLKALGPAAVLARGYSITFHPDGRAVRSVRDVSPGQGVRTRLKDGEFGSRVV